MLITVNKQMLFTIGILLIFAIMNTTNGLRQSRNKAKKMLLDICERLSDDDLDPTENRKWNKFCKEWMLSTYSQEYHNIQDRNTMDEADMELNAQPRRSGSSSSSGSRSSSSGSRSSSSSGSRTSSGTSGSRISSGMTRYSSTRTGAVISRPAGSLWSRSRSTFIPVSNYYYYRSYPVYHHYTTPANESGTYYYCTPNNTNTSMEIQCSTIYGDDQCCGDNTVNQTYCCGGQVDGDFVEDFNRATQTVARIFYTLSAIALFIHIFMRRLYR